MCLIHSLIHLNLQLQSNKKGCIHCKVATYLTQRSQVLIRSTKSCKIGMKRLLIGEGHVEYGNWIGSIDKKNTLVVKVLRSQKRPQSDRRMTYMPQKNGIIGRV